MRVRTRSIRYLGLAAVVAMIAAASAAPSARQSAASQVVVRAVDAEGQPVLDLKQDELSLRIDGRPREIKSLELVRPTAAAARAAAPAVPAIPPSDLPPPYATNRGGAAVPKGAREFVIAIDDEGIAPGREQPVREAVKTLIASLSPGDAVGLAGLKSGGMRLSPTTDHAAALTALSKIVAMGSAGESTTDLGCRTRTVLAGVGALLQDAPPARTLVVFSSGVATPLGDTIRQQLGKQADADAAICQVRQRDLDELGRHAAGSAAGVYVVFVPEALGNAANLSTAEAGLENLAGVTGGEMIRLVGTANAVERIGRTAGTYYLATVDDAAAGSRRIDARVARDGVRVVARPAGSTAAAPKAASPRDMIRTAAVFRDLPLRAAGFVSRQQGSGDLKVIALFEPDEPDAKLTAATVGLFDEKGTLKAQWTAQPAELAKAPVTAALAIAPGRYRMRVAATDASGRAGTTDVTLDVQLAEAPPLKMGTMVLVGSKGLADPKLAFTGEDAVAIGVLELYGVAKDAKLDVTFEIAQDATGAAMGSGQGSVAAGQGEDARLVYGGFPLGTLEPGDYVLRARITVDGQEAGVASRTLRRFK
ncbi:MAG TPA: hypothetical protein VM364_08695 [Vicinamibacterales bacterium]|nr:hypothetical protein [Vicinamibacterales bacterium]